jgi:TolB protein
MLLFLPVFEARAQEDVYMKIQTGGFQPIRIRIPPFSSQQPTDLTDELRQVVVNDLEYSGFFRIVSSTGSADSPEISENGDPTNRAAEVELGAELALSGNTLSISAKLEELPGRQAIFKKEFDSSLQKMRWLAHGLADEVVYYLVGEQGIASTKIAFSTGNRMKKEIALIDYDGYNFHKLTDTGALNLSPTWSPSGDYLLFTSYVSGNPDLIKMSMENGKLDWISKKKGLNSAPAWSPDRDKVALTFSANGNADIYTMNAEGRNWQRLTQSPAIDSSPSWSPTGNQIAFTSDRSGNPQIYIMDSEGGSVMRLTFQGTYNDSPTWSPRGDRIAFVSREEGRFQIYTVNVNGENLQRVTDGIGNNENPSWSPNGLKLAFASDRTGSWNIYAINWDGTDLRKVTPSGESVTPEWSPRLKSK